MRKPVVSLIIGGGHSIGIPLAVSAKKSFIVRSATMTLHPVRTNGLIIGVSQTFTYFQKMQERITSFIVSHSDVKKEELEELIYASDFLAGDIGTVIDGKKAVEIGLIDSLGGLSEALDALKSAIPAKPKPMTEQVKAEAAAVAEAVQSANDGKPATLPAAEAEKPKPKAKKAGVDVVATATSWTARATQKSKEAVDKMTKFLSEFSYFRDGVSMRLINTFARAGSMADKKAVLASYCDVSAMEDYPELVEKMKSPEFKEVCDTFDALCVTPKPVNKRFAVFYGNPGGGKTYAAERICAEINGDGHADVVICSSGMDAADMLYAYRLDYATGKKGYVPTGLLDAMLAGRAVVLDEVNLLPMEARMFLQNILDNKGHVNVMGKEIPIRDGFFVVGTMNPETGNGKQPLPLPLVDRAAVIKEFKTSSSQAAVGAGLC
jgi:DNA replication protein DnaC